jgi:hypothetical protein
MLGLARRLVRPTRLRDDEKAFPSRNFVLSCFVAFFHRLAFGDPESLYLA